MKNPITLLEALRHSLPVRLVQRQVRGHKGSLGMWVFLFAVLFGWVANGFGALHLFLEPEYLGKESFTSHLIVGLAFGAFLFAYMVSIYINESYRFPFIVYHKRPFFLFTFNNLLIPGLFLAVYLSRFVTYHLALRGDVWQVALITSGLVAGMGLMFLLSSAFFFSPHSIMTHVSEKLEEGIVGKENRRNRWVILGKARDTLRFPEHTGHYLVFPFRWKKPQPHQPAHLREIIRILNQNHGKILLLQILIFSFFALLGLMDNRPVMQIPAGASLLMILAFSMLIMGALTFWFRRAGFTLVVVLGLAVFFYSKSDALREKNQAFGLDYGAAPAEYSAAALARLADPAFAAADRSQALAALESWKRTYQRVHGPQAKPRLVLVCASGGGLRSAYWTFSVMQALDSLSGGEVSQQTRLMTGASGGMIGLAYYRELLFRQQQGEALTLSDPAYGSRISGDMLNRIFLRMFTDLLLPNRQVQVGAHRYDRETGFAFDDQLAQNLPEFAGRRLSDYAPLEQRGVIPQLVLTPTIINQGRKLYISSSPVAYLTQPRQISAQYASKFSGVEFRRLFANQQADSLLMTTALRMNATFPLVLPVVELPSEPAMRVMDAGAIDNYGTQTAVRYLYEFRDWFARNTSDVLLIQIRDNTRQDPIRDLKPGPVWLSKYGQPLQGGLYSMVEAKDMSNDYLLEFVKSWYRGKVEVLPFEYPKEISPEPASLSWHLTEREKGNIYQSLGTELNVRSFAAIQEYYEPRLFATGKGE